MINFRVIAISLAISTSTFAQKIDTLKEVTITENRISSNLAEVNRNVTVVQKHQIEKLPALTISEVLTYVSGVDLRQRGIGGIQGDLSIRGGGFDQSMVMLNGMKLTDPQTGHHLLNLPVAIDNIQQIEVNKGPAAKAFGLNAYNGAINLITEASNKKQINASFYAGDFALFGANLYASLPYKKGSQSLGVSYEISDGYRKHSEYKNLSAMYEHKVNLDKGDIRFMLGINEKEFGAGGFYVPNSQEWEETETYFVGAIHNYENGNWRTRASLNWRQNQDHYIFHRQNPEWYQNFHTTNVINGDYNTAYTSKLGTSAIGVEYRLENIESDNVAFDVIKPNLGDRSRTNIGAYAEHKFTFNKLDIHPGIYLNNNSDFGMNIMPNVNVGYPISEKSRVYASFNQSLRAPTYTDLYYAGPSNIGNPDLESELSSTYELGIRNFFGKHYLAINGFYRNANNVIDWVKASDTVLWQPKNHTQIVALGLEILYKLRPFDLLFMKNNMLSIDYTYINQEISNTGDLISRYSLSNYKHQLVTSLFLNITKQVRLSTTYRFLDRVTMNNYSLLDIKVEYKVKKYRFFAMLSNITDTKYSETGFVQMPGRWIKGGVRASF